MRCWKRQLRKWTKHSLSVLSFIAKTLISLRMKSARNYSRVFFSSLTLKKCSKSSNKNERKRKLVKRQRWKSNIMKTTPEIRRQSSRILNQTVRIKMIRYLKVQLSFLCHCLQRNHLQLQRSMRRIDWSSSRKLSSKKRKSFCKKWWRNEVRRCRLLGKARCLWAILLTLSNKAKSSSWKDSDRKSILSILLVQ